MIKNSFLRQRLNDVVNKAIAMTIFIIIFMFEPKFIQTFLI